jgi:hypothetical protein
MAPESGPTQAARARRLATARIALGLAALFTSSCSQDIGALDVPWTLGASPTPLPPGSAKAAAAAAAEDEGAPGDCDDLPPLTPDELSGPPYDLSLQKPARPGAESPPRYTVLDDVTLSPEAASKMDRIDDIYFKKTGKHLVITSGTRDAARQAKAMFKMIRLGADIMRLYRNKDAAREVKQAYDRTAGKPADDRIEAMYDVLKAQIDRGVFISAHLRAGAVDVRNKTMSAADKRAFLKSVAEASGASVLEETKPPHYHLQLD